jgi:hypothetical protein
MPTRCFTWPAVAGEPSAVDLATSALEIPTGTWISTAWPIAGVVLPAALDELAGPNRAPRPFEQEDPYPGRHQQILGADPSAE